MKRSKKAIALILSMLLAFSLLPLSAAAAIRVNNTFAEGVYTGVGIGGYLCNKKLMDEGNYEEIADRARKAVAQAAAHTR